MPCWDALGQDFACASASGREIFPCHVEAGRALHACDKEPSCVGLVLPAGTATLKQEHNFSAIAISPQRAAEM